MLSQLLLLWDKSQASLCCKDELFVIRVLLQKDGMKQSSLVLPQVLRGLG